MYVCGRPPRLSNNSNSMKNDGLDWISIDDTLYKYSGSDTTSVVAMSVFTSAQEPYVKKQVRIWRLERVAVVRKNEYNRIINAVEKNEPFCRVLLRFKAMTDQMYVSLVRLIALLLFSHVVVCTIHNRGVVLLCCLKRVLRIDSTCCVITTFQCERNEVLLLLLLNFC